MIAIGKKAENIFKDIIANRSKKCDSKELRDIEDNNQEFVLVIDEPKPKVFISMDEKGIRFHLRYLTDPKRRLVTRQFIVEDILEVLEHNKDIKFAFQTHVVETTHRL